MSTNAVSTLRLTFPSDTGYLHVVANLARNAAQAAGLDEGDAGKVALATDEAVTNVIEHAYHGQAGRTIEVVVRLLEDGVEVRVIHEGDPIDEASLPRYDPDEYRRRRRKGGLGVVLMRRLMDRVEFRSTSDQRSECCLEKRRPQEPETQGSRSPRDVAK